MTDDNLRKKLLYRSWHRGTREMDLILGRFAERHLPAMNGAALARYEALLGENDPDIYGWITEPLSPPAEWFELIERIKDGIQI